MDTERHDYFLITGTSPESRGIWLQGTDDWGQGAFAGASGQCWVVDSGNKWNATDKIISMHICNRGHMRFWQDTAPFTCPAILTTNDRLVCIYDGPVKLSKCDPTAFDVAIPVRGRNFLGAVFARDNLLTLTAFSDSIAMLPPRSEVFCPWWSEGLNDEPVFDLMF